MEKFNEQEVYRWFEIFKEGNQLTEIRIISNDGKNGSGYFTDAKTLIEAVRPYTNDYSVYFTINRVNPECYGRPQRDKIILRPKNTTSDSEIIARDYILLDLDSKRTTGVTATEEQLQAAKNKANEIFKYLRENGFYEPIVICSGSGVHMYIRCALKSSPENDILAKRFISAIAMLFSDENVEVDQKVFNPARISRVVGFYNRKGSKTDPLRPQRLCSFAKIPREIKVNEKEYFEKIAALYPDDEIKPSRENNYSSQKFDLDGFIEKHGIKVTKIEEVAGGKKYVLEHCIFNEQHRGKDAVIFQRDNGAISYVCFHNSCSNYTWKDVRLKYEPNAYDMDDYKEFQYKQRYYSQVSIPFTPVKETKEKGKKWLSFKDIKTTRVSDVVAIPSGFTQLDRAMKGFLLGEVTLLSGINGSGKSSWLNIIMINAIHRGFKVACFSGELTGENMKRWMFLPTAGKQYSVKDPNHDNIYDVSDKVVGKIEDWYDDKFFLFNNDYGNRYEQILSDIKEIVTEKNIRLIVIDNLMAVNLGEKGDKNDKQKNFILEVVDFAKKYQVHVIMVCHPRKESGNQTLLRKESISGSSDLGNAVQNIIIIHRVGEDFAKRAGEFFGKQKAERYLEYGNVIEICKNRSFGIVDYLVGMYFEPETRRFKNFQAESIHYGWEEQPTQTSLIHDDACKNSPFEQPIEDCPF